MNRIIRMRRSSIALKRLSSAYVRAIRGKRKSAGVAIKYPDLNNY